MKRIILCIALSLGVVFSVPSYSRDYQEYTQWELENMSFGKWWQITKLLAKKQGIYIEEHERQYWREYWEDGYFPHEALEEEYGGDF